MMIQQYQIYKCQDCDNIIEVLHSGADKLACCGQPMVLQQENTVDASKEKHVPVIDWVENKTVVKVGSAPHPMEEEHYIEWIEIKVDSKAGKKFLKPGDSPEAKFCATGDKAQARAYCNLHGLWRS
jgi:superoxide reductase